MIGDLRVEEGGGGRGPAFAKATARQFSLARKLEERGARLCNRLRQLRRVKSYRTAVFAGAMTGGRAGLTAVIGDQMIGNR